MENFEKYAEQIYSFQRNNLDQQGLKIEENELQSTLRTAINLSVPLPVWMAQIKTIPRLWQDNVKKEKKDLFYFTKDILAGLNGQKLPVFYLIHGKKQSVDLYVGTPDESSGHNIRALFTSQYHGIKLLPEINSQPITETGNLNQELNERIRPFLNNCKHIGIVTGVPTPVFGEEESMLSQIDRLVRGLYGSEWAMLVLAEPENDINLISGQLKLIKEQLIIEQEEKIKEWQQKSQQDTGFYFLQLLKLQHKRFEEMLKEGGWWYQTYICSPDQAIYDRAKALIKSIYSGEHSRIDRIRVIDAPGAGTKLSSFSPVLVKDIKTSHSVFQSDGSKYRTLVSSSQLSAFMHLPRTEMPGYYIKDFASFDVNSHVPDNESTISIGNILDKGHPTGNTYKVLVSDLTKHCLTVGITGSGKTNTTFYMLEELQKLEKPVSFLVLEPAKREYRKLAKLLPDANNLRIFTVGEETESSAPFRLNPFEIRYGVSVQTHIDLLKSVFNASFGMWAPLPQLLEKAIHEVYIDKGWDIINNTNDLALDVDKKEWHIQAQPTLTDLYHKISDILPKLGYDKEITKNMKTSLETRINSLRIGSKGRMLDTQKSIPIEYLLENPTILELEGVGDDEEKAFVMGMLLTSLYEYYRSNPDLPEDHMHITIVEEAHRLLSNVQAKSDSESGNQKGKAVETFVNMLSEVRAYGEGFIIAEQIPTKLAPDVIKNTALKIMHRIVSKDDREAMGSAMNLDNKQMRQIVELGIGEAAVHGGGKYADDRPIIIKVPEAKGETKDIELNINIRNNWNSFIQSYPDIKSVYRKYSTCEIFCLPENSSCSTTSRIADNEEFNHAFEVLFLTFIAGYLVKLPKDELIKYFINTVENCKQMIQQHTIGRSINSSDIRCTVTHAIYYFIEKQGLSQKWNYNESEELIQLIFPFINSAFTGVTQAENHIAKALEFCEKYIGLNKQLYEPYYGCLKACGLELQDGCYCIYRNSVSSFLDNTQFAEGFADLDVQGWPPDNTGLLLKWVAGQLIHLDGDAEKLRSCALCFFIQKIHQQKKLFFIERQNLIDMAIEYYDNENNHELTDNE